MVTQVTKCYPKVIVKGNICGMRVKNRPTALVKRHVTKALDEVLGLILR